MIGIDMIMEELKKKKNIDYDKLKSNLERIAPTQNHYDNLLELLDFVYYLGMDDGDSNGYKEALKDNGYDEDTLDEARNIAYDEGYDTGRDEGLNDARMGIDDELERSYIDGYADGESKGHRQGHNEGEQLGYDNGFDDGKREGYDNGFNDGDSEGYERGYDIAKYEHE